jgi:putative ABC transport system permease protein
MTPEIAKQLEALPETAVTASVRIGPFEADGGLSYLNATNPATASQLFDFGTIAGSFEDLSQPNTIGISKKIADNKGWKVGDTVPVKFQQTGEKQFKVAYIFDRNVFGDYWISLDTYEQNYPEQLDFIVMTKMNPGVTPEQGRAALEPILKPYPNLELQDNAQYKADQQAQIDQIVALIYILLLLALITALVGIANTLALSIHERTREIGLLRAVGTSRRQIRSMVRWESVIICLLGAINGLAIGLFFGWSVVTALKDEGFSTFAIAPGQLIVVVIVLVLASLLSAFFPARRAAKLDILRAISSE